MGKRKEKLKRVVVDTNVLISALLFEGISSQLVNSWKEGIFRPLMSKAMLTELIKVFAYPKFSLSDSEIRNILTEEILPYFEVVEIREEITGVCLDHEDDKFISCAVNGKADFIVTGDKSLYRVQKYRNTLIVSVSEFTALLENKS